MPEEQRPALSFIAAAMWTIGAVFLLDLTVRVTEAVRPGASLDLINVTACHVLTYSALVLVMLRIYAPETRVREEVAFRAPAPIWVIGAALLGAGIYPALDVLDAAIARRFPMSTEDVESIGKLLAAPTVARRILIGVAFLGIIPAVCEVFFRGVLFGGLRKAGRESLVILGTAVYFTAARAPNERTLASSFALGLLLGWVRERSGSIVASFVAHTSFFLVPVLPLLLGRDPAADLVVPPVLIGAGLGVAALVGALFEWRARRTG
jgi:membrane protease YdiL (CAAX protease family)